MKISSKLMLMAALAVFSLTALTLFNHYSASQSEAAQASLARDTDALLHISEANEDLLAILLAAMDMIVDKDEGAPKPELTKEVEDHYAAIQKAIAGLIEQTNDEAIATKYRSILDKVTMVHGTITKDLYTAITSHAGDEAFVALDDGIDGAGSEASKMLEATRVQILEKFKETSAAQTAQAAHANRILWIAYACSALALIVLISLIIRSITRPIANVTANIRAIAAGDAGVAIAALGRRDEIGSIAESLEVLRTKAEEAFQLKLMVDDMPVNIMTADVRNDFKITYTNKASKTTLRSLQQYMPMNVDAMENQSIDIFHKDPQRIRMMLSNPANLPHQAKISIGTETLDLKVSGMFNKLGEYVGVMLAWTVVTQNVRLANDFEGSVGAVSNQLSSSATMLTERATSLQGAIEELSVSALEISKRVNDSLEIVRKAVETGDAASEQTAQLSSSAEKISNVVTLIRSIAEKTNLLALNATIESARAGDAGKGFAVVANEVKTLAGQTGNAISEISKQIHEIQTAASNNAEAILSMCEIVKQVNIISTTIAGTIEEQQAATAEIARNISGSDICTPNHQGTTVMGLAMQLDEVSSHLNGECERFLNKVRAI